MSVVARARGLLGRSETVRVSATSAMTVVIRLVGTGVTFLYTLLMARTMSPADVGLVWSIWSASFIAAIFTTMNIGSGAVREVVKARVAGNDGVAAGFVVVSRRTFLLASPVVVLVLLALIGWRWASEAGLPHAGAYVIGALSVPLLGWVQTNASQATAFDRMLASHAPRELVRPFLFILVFAVAWFAGLRPTVEFVVATYVVAVAIAALIQYRLIRSAFGFMRTTVPDTGAWRDWIVSGLTLSPMLLLAEFLRNVVILSAALVLDRSAVGQIAVALSVVNFLNFGIAAVDTAFSPKLAQALARGARPRVDHFLAVSNVLKAGPTLAGGLVLAFAAEPILRLFGPHYAQGADAAVWFLLIPVSKAVFGNSTLVMQVSGHRKEIFWSSLATIVLMSLAIVAAGHWAGVEAASAAGSLAFAALQLFRYVACLRMTGVDTSLRGTLATLVRRRRAGAAGEP